MGYGAVWGEPLVACAGCDVQRCGGNCSADTPHHERALGRRAPHVAVNARPVSYLPTMETAMRVVQMLESLLCPILLLKCALIRSGIVDCWVQGRDMRGRMF